MRFAGWMAAIVVASACSGGSDERSVSTAVTTSSAPGGAASTAASTASTATTTTTSTDAGPRLVDWQCPSGDPSGRSCHRLEVPADWSDPRGPTISLPIVVLPATGPSPHGGAIVIPAGGPGFEGLGGSAYWGGSVLTVDHDVVLYDQRGTGRAEPLLECPERDKAFVANLQRDESFETERAAILQGLSECRTRLEAEGVDLDDYDTEASVKDLDAIRQALGYESWNLLGSSYGARLSLAAMRSTPEHIRSVILDSVYDVTAGGFGQTTLDAERAFRQLVDGCAADRVCRTAHPDVAATISSVRDRYNASPIIVDVDLGDDAGNRTFVITGEDVMGGLFNALYDSEVIPLLPSILDALAAGDTGVVPELIRRGVPFATAAADGMQLSVDCADNAGLGDALDRAGWPTRAAPGCSWRTLSAPTGRSSRRRTRSTSP